MAAQKVFTLVQTLGAAAVFSAVACWYGFMFGRESARKELGGIIEDLRRANSKPNSGS
uniref:Membrane lipoprotein n=1 Tax=Kalanchoe fedtschenkoi TaxID=63787 RepID=A0A7N0UZG0_KALFE